MIVCREILSTSSSTYFSSRCRAVATKFLLLHPNCTAGTHRWGTPSFIGYFRSLLDSRARASFKRQMKVWPVDWVLPIPTRIVPWCTIMLVLIRRSIQRWRTLEGYLYGTGSLRFVFLSNCESKVQNATEGIVVIEYNLRDSARSALCQKETKIVINYNSLMYGFSYERITADDAVEFKDLLNCGWRCD